MAATQGTSGFGTLLKRGDGASPTEAFAAVAEVKNISGPNLSTETIDATHMESPNAFREMLPSFKSSGEVTFTVNFLPGATNHTDVLGDYDDRTLRNWTLVFPDTGATTWGFSGYVTGFQPSATIDDVLSADVTITISGAVDFDV